MLPSLALAGSLALHTSAPAHAAQRSLAQPRDLRPAARRRHATVLAATEAATVLVETGMPELPNGERITLELASFDEVGTGSHVWPSAKALCRWQDYAANRSMQLRLEQLHHSAHHTYDRRTCGLILDSRRHACPGARRRHWRRRPLRCGAGCTRGRAHRWPERRAPASAPQHCAQPAASCSSAPAAGSNTCWWPGGPTVVSGGTCAWKTASGARALQWPAGGLCGGARGAAAVGARPAAALGTLRLGARQRPRVSRDERPAGPAKPVQVTAAA